MTSAADSSSGSLARQAPYGETDHEGSLRAGAERSPEHTKGRSTHHPVFAAFDALGMTGRDVADIADVTAPTVSKWRAGKAKLPDDRLAFLTLVLAHVLDDIGDLAARDPVWHGRVDSARAYLTYQDVLNRGLAVTDVHDGARMFRVWWQNGGAVRLREKRFATPVRET